MSQNQEYLFYYALQSPLILGTVFAAALCLLRHRENPRGAALLGLAILANLIACAPTLVFRHFPGAFNHLVSLVADQTFASVALLLFTAGLSGLSWVLIGLAVFARGAHTETSSPDATAH